MRWVVLGIVVVVSGVAWLISRGDDELRVEIARSTVSSKPRELPAPSPDSRAVNFSVELGCVLEEGEGEIRDYELEETATAVTVTFSGKESDNGADCLTTAVRAIELSNPLGGRSICDGSSDPPEEIWPSRRRGVRMRPDCPD